MGALRDRWRRKGEYNQCTACEGTSGVEGIGIVKRGESVQEHRTARAGEGLRLEEEIRALCCEGLDFQPPGS